MVSNRFVLSIRCAPSTLGNGKYRRPVNIRILDTETMQSEWHAVRGFGGKVAEWSNVDSRYSGERSAYGQALRAAKEMVDTLNAGHANRVSQSVVI